MRRIQGFSLFVLALAAVWVLAVWSDAQAQEKGQAEDKSKKTKEKTEQVIEKDKAGKDKSKENSGEETVTGDSKAEHIKKIKYKPHGMTDADLMEWTDGNPPGWSRGEKSGWGGAGAPPGQMKKQGEVIEVVPVYPRGSENWDAGRKRDWQTKLEQSKARVLERVRTKGGTSPQDEESAIISLEGAAREGVPIEHVETTVDRAITKGMRGRDIETMTRALSYGADKNTDYAKLNQFVEKKMDEGETGDALALSIYKEIDEQHAKPEEPAKKPWWKRLFGG